MSKTSNSRGRSAIEKIGEYKMKVLSKCLDSQVLSKLLSVDSPDALFTPDLSDRDHLIYNKIYPYRFVPETVENEGTYLTIGIGGFKKYRNGLNVFEEYQSGDIFIHMFTHTNLMRTDNGVRQDLMLAEIVRIFDRDTSLGMGELHQSSLNELWMHNNKFGGYSVGFTVVDFR